MFRYSASLAEYRLRASCCPRETRPDWGRHEDRGLSADEVIGFGIQVRESGRKSFTLDCMFERRRRRLFIGDFPDWSTVAARE